MDFIDDFKAILLEHYKPAEVGTITDLVTVVLQHYDVQPKQTGLVVYEQSDVELVQKFFVAKVTEGLTERTLACYQACLKTALSSMNKHIKDITTNDIRAHLVKMKLRGCSERTMNNVRRVLSSFFGYLLKEGEITANPVARIAKIKEPKKLKKPLTELQLETLKLNAGIREKAIMEFLYSTGCRVAEMVGLDLSDVDLEKGEAVVLGKGKKYRTVFLTPKCVLYIKNYLSTRTDKEPPLFVGQLKPHGRLNTSSVGALLRELGRKCGIEKVHPHRFRRTCATMALHRGMPIDQVRLMLGHESIETTTIYAEESMDVVKHTLNTCSPGLLNASVELELRTSEIGTELKKIFDELNQEYEKRMDLQKEQKEQKLRELLENLCEQVPTLLVIGMTADKHCASFMDSPEEDNLKRKIDLCAAIAMMMEQNQELREVIFSAVSWFMQENPKYRDAMQEALNKLKELDEHQRTAQPE